MDFALLLSIDATVYHNIWRNDLLGRGLCSLRARLVWKRADDLAHFHLLYPNWRKLDQWAAHFTTEPDHFSHVLQCCWHYWHVSSTFLWRNFNAPALNAPLRLSGDWGGVAVHSRMPSPVWRGFHTPLHHASSSLTGLTQRESGGSLINQLQEINSECVIMNADLRSVG